MKSLKVVLTDLEKKDLWNKEHYPPISKNYLKTLFSGNTPFLTMLHRMDYKKLWFEIMWSLCKQGQENIRSMTKATFRIGKDDTGKQNRVPIHRRTGPKPLGRYRGKRYGRQNVRTITVFFKSYLILIYSTFWVKSIIKRYLIYRKQKLSCSVLSKVHVHQHTLYWPKWFLAQTQACF